MPQYLAGINDGRFVVERDEARHLKVARVRAGDEIKIFDGGGAKYLAKIESLTDKAAAGNIIKEIPVRLPAREITLCFAAVSRPATEDLLDKCTQAGVYAFRPVITARSDAELLKKWASKKERWQSIILSACKQCEMARLPLLLEPQNFEVALQSTIPAVICYEGEHKTNILQAVDSVKTVRALGLFIGPEGGFTAEEVALAQKHKVISVTLGANILRVETAATVACWAALQ
jgi:16S rRNA (uracil1498-N3)-methyltransferase